jgi:hypothetical protein
MRRTGVKTTVPDIISRFIILATGIDVIFTTKAFIKIIALGSD